MLANMFIKSEPEIEINGRFALAVMILGNRVLAVSRYMVPIESAATEIYFQQASGGIGSVLRTLSQLVSSTSG